MVCKLLSEQLLTLDYLCTIRKIYTIFRNNLFLTEIRKFQYADFSSFMIPIGMPKKKK